MSVATADLLASPEALADYRKVPFDVDDRHAIKMLEVASAFIRSKTGQTLSLVTDDTQDLRGTWGRLWLPQRPVIAVHSVSVRYRGDTFFTTVVDAVAERRGLVSAWSSWGGPDATVRVNYDHGYDPIPEDIVGVCLAIASRRYGNAASGTVGSESIGNYSYTNATAPDGTPIGVTAEELDVLENYRPKEWS